MNRSQLLMKMAVILGIASMLEEWQKPKKLNKDSGFMNYVNYCFSNKGRVKRYKNRGRI